MALGGVQALFGLGQYIKGSKMDPKRPEYEIPSEVFAAENLARSRLYGGLPGENIMRQDLEQGFASSIDAARRSGGNVDALVAGAGGALQGGYQNLGAQRAQYKAQAEQSLAQQFGLTAQYRDQAFELNQMQPYMDEVADKSRLMEGGIQNMFGGGKSAATALSYDQMMKSLEVKTPDIPGGGGGSVAGLWKSSMTPMFENMQKFATGRFAAANPQVYDSAYAEPDMYSKYQSWDEQLKIMDEMSSMKGIFEAPPLPSWGTQNMLNNDF